MFQRLAAAVLLFTYYGASTPNNPNMPENYEESSSPGIYQLDCFSGSTSDLFFNRLNALFSCVVFSSSCSFLLCLTQFFLLSSLTHPILHLTIIIGSQFCGLQNRHQKRSSTDNRHGFGQFRRIQPPPKRSLASDRHIGAIAIQRVSFGWFIRSTRWYGTLPTGWPGRPIDNRHASPCVWQRSIVQPQTTKRSTKTTFF